MAQPHAGYAAASIVSERFLDFCLATYVATYADAQHATWSWTTPATINGVKWSLAIDADAVLISLATTLRASAGQSVAVRGRFYAKAHIAFTPATQLVPSTGPVPGPAWRSSAS